MKAIKANIASFHPMLYLAYFVFSLMAALSCVYLDEGIDPVKLLRPDVWVILGFTALVLVFVQVGVREIMLKSYNGKHKSALSGLMGITVGLLLVYTLFYTIS